MLVFRDAPGVPVDAPVRSAALRRDAATLEAAGPGSHDAAVALVIETGMLEAAMADAAGEHGSERDAIRLAHLATRAAAKAVAASWDGDRSAMRRAAADAGMWLERMTPPAALRRLHLRTPEGYAYYGLYPETYLQAARAIGARRRPRTAAVIGIRSIGTSLGAVAAAGLELEGCVVSSWTVRPSGHPFAREVRLDAEAAAALSVPSAHGAGSRTVADLVLVVDEGPGLSGSSFAATLDAIARAGVPRDRTVILPAHDPDPRRLLSSDAARVWDRHEKCLSTFERTWVESGRLGRATGLTPCADLSAGRWRARFGGSPDVAVHPQHERRKYLARDEGGRPFIVKFAGLGMFGRALAGRAARLAGTAAIESDVRLAAGFLWRPAVAGTPMSAHGVDGTFLLTAAEYLAAIGRRFQTGAEADGERLAHMLAVNAPELFPGAALERLSSIAAQARACRGRAAVQLDARMLPHEWIRTAGGRAFKVDALEHHDDHFYPGPHDLAWDVAAFIVEFDLGPAAREAFTRLVEAEAGTLADRLEFFEAAYLAFRAAYCLMGAGALGDAPDGRRLGAAGTVYREKLGRMLAGGGAFS